MPYTKPFNQITKNDASTAGGKGSSLGEMFQAGIPVPLGFVVLSSAFDKVLSDTDIGVEIDAILDTVDIQKMHTVEHASEKIQGLIMRAQMPQEIADEIITAYSLLCRDESQGLSENPDNASIPSFDLSAPTKASGHLSPYLVRGRLLPGESKKLLIAVRSSATAEDSSSAAWAGQLESYLNTTKDNLLLNIQKCWASLFTPRAIFYRFEKGYSSLLFTPSSSPLEEGENRSRLQSSPVPPLFKGRLGGVNDQKISVAVVIQQMVQSEISGIAFSVHPVTQDRNQLIIEAGYGLGEAIVSGQITPDSYVVTKNPLEIIDKNVSEQTRMLVRSENGGNEWSPVFVIPAKAGIQSADENNPGSRIGVRDDKTKNEQKLSDSQILELSALIIKIESHYGCPVDIEWAWADGQFYITQSRPITTLSAQPIPIFHPSAIDWWKVMERKNLFFVGLAFADVETIEVAKLLGFGIKYQMFKHEHDIWSSYRSTKEYEKLHKHLSGLIKNDDQKFFAYAKLGAESNKAAEDYIRRHDQNPRRPTLQNYDKEYKIYRDALTYGVTIPWFVIGAFETMPIEDKKKYKSILDLYEPLRAISIYPDFEKKILQKYRSSLSKKYRIDEKLFNLLAPWELRLAVMTDLIPEQAMLERRERYCVYWRNQEAGAFDFVYDSTIEEHVQVLQKLSIENTALIKGTIAHKGKVQGNVRVIYEPEDCEDFIEGEILVSPSTNPSLMPAIVKCLGIVTDEGGMTSHAAIIARELKKPGVIGTKVATQVLKDGDLVEVDADNGVVRVLERASVLT